MKMLTNCTKPDPESAFYRHPLRTKTYDLSETFRISICAGPYFLVEMGPGEK